VTCAISEVCVSLSPLQPYIIPVHITQYIATYLCWWWIAYCPFIVQVYLCGVCGLISFHISPPNKTNSFIQVSQDWFVVVSVSEVHFFLRDWRLSGFQITTKFHNIRNTLCGWISAIHFVNPLPESSSFNLFYEPLQPDWISPFFITFFLPLKNTKLFLLWIASIHLFIFTFSHIAQAHFPFESEWVCFIDKYRIQVKIYLHSWIGRISNCVWTHVVFNYLWRRHMNIVYISHLPCILLCYWRSG